ncbi:MAG: hypothetical protein JJ975_15180 [Bacteroidia bacterium]|nr:hypothetical protein [Bacteroidia bacterium]
MNHIPKNYPVKQNAPAGNTGSLAITICHRLSGDNPCKPSSDNPQPDTDLNQLLLDTLANKGELNNSEIKWKSPTEVELSSVSMMTLHNFTLEAEKRGKKVNYEKNVIISITD